MCKLTSVLRASAWALVLCLGLPPAAAAVETYVETMVDPSGQLHIMTKHHREIVPKREPRQVGFEKVEISPDSRAVGWLALFPDGCASDPVPMKLEVYVDGKVHTFTGSGLPFQRWRFQAEGKQVAYEQETVHGSLGVHYELRDIATGKLVAQFGPDSDADSIARPPRWVAEVNSGL